MSKQVCLFAFAIIFAIVLLSKDVSAMSVWARVPRAINEEKVKKCYEAAPCGWEIYIPFTRERLDYMSNTCECDTGTECVKSDDDISVSAYVFRCKPINSKNPDTNKITEPSDQ